MASLVNRRLIMTPGPVAVDTCFTGNEQLNTRPIRSDFTDLMNETMN